ncbi:hypothetical protein I6E44_11355 [Pseudoflavonifractor phocaeensis]|nr:hypothetical protein [Pseudoflavonifractor phocaeensis]MCF2677088.1 hypothetical protein [Pseudoflavonifractor phocaeensis]
MLRVNDILLAVEALTQERFSDLKAYRNVVRKGFKRPSFLTEVGKQTMEDFTHFTVDRTAQVKITFFETVDDYHDSQIETLSDRLTVALELFSCAAIRVEDRYLDISGTAGEVFNDYAELNFTLSWQDDRDITPVAAAPLEDYDISVTPDGREEE